MFKVFFNDEEILSLSDTQEKVLKNEIRSEEFEKDMKRRIQWVIMHKYEQCFDRLEKEWKQELIYRGYSSFPVDKEEFANIIFNQDDYKNRSERESKG